ncbi:MAG: hypothetical protein IRY95_00470 [Clostridia bacterium]|nr:hypothetical protein [Clostridia bacterium]
MERLLEKDAVVRVLAVVLAVLLWYQVRGEPPSAQKLVHDVPVHVRNVPPDLVAVSVNPQVVTVVVRGDSRILNGLSRDDFEAWVDMRGAKVGRLAYAVDSVLVPKGVTLVDYSPAEVTAVVERRVEREEVVSVSLTGQVAEGSVAGPPKAEPDRVIVSGPESLMQRVVRVQAYVNVQGASQPVDSEVQVAAVDREGRPVEGVQVLPPRVVVRVPVVPERVGKAVPVRPDVRGRPSPPAAVLGVEVTPPTVTVVGPPSVVDQLEAVATEVIDVSGERSDVRRQVGLVLPEGISLVEGTPARVLVHVRVGP